jgi:hypothetical protein
MIEEITDLLKSLQELEETDPIGHDLLAEVDRILDKINSSEENVT